MTLATLKSFAQRLSKATSDVVGTVTDIRAQIAAKRAEIKAVERAPLPLDEVRARVKALVADLGTAWVAEHGYGMMHGPRHTPGLAEARPGRPGLASEALADWFGLLAAADPAHAERLVMSAFARIEGYQPGAPADERPAMLARLRAELAALEEADEKAVDDAVAAGVAVDHRPDVVRRREAAKRKAELDEEAAARRAEREREVERRYQEALRPRQGRSAYIASGGEVV